jgi:DNA-directed RNA polymerase subunit H (RpoH/RPB5)
LPRKKIDVLRHDLTPKHILLTKEQAEDLLDKYKIRYTDLPEIFEKDPAAIAIGARKGDVIKIIRDSETTVDEIEYFRYVKKEKK